MPPSSSGRLALLLDLSRGGPVLPPVFRDPFCPRLPRLGPPAARPLLATDWTSAAGVRQAGSRRLPSRKSPPPIRAGSARQAGSHLPQLEINLWPDSCGSYCGRLLPCCRNSRSRQARSWDPAIAHAKLLAWSLLVGCCSGSGQDRATAKTYRWTVAFRQDAQDVPAAFSQQGHNARLPACLLGRGSSHPVKAVLTRLI